MLIGKHTLHCVKRPSPFANRFGPPFCTCEPSAVQAHTFSIRTGQEKGAAHSAFCSRKASRLCSFSGCTDEQDARRTAQTGVAWLDLACVWLALLLASECARAKGAGSLTIVQSRYPTEYRGEKLVR